MFPGLSPCLSPLPPLIVEIEKRRGRGENVNALIRDKMHGAESFWDLGF